MRTIQTKSFGSFFITVNLGRIVWVQNTENGSKLVNVSQSTRHIGLNSGTWLVYTEDADERIESFVLDSISDLEIKINEQKDSSD